MARLTLEGRRGHTLYLTVRQQVKHLSKEDFSSLRQLCRAAKNLTNEALYNVRQYFFSEGGYLRYESNYKLLKTSPNYRTLNSNMAQQILKEVDGSFRSFFGLMKQAKEGRYSMKDCRLPKYLPKDGYQTLIIGFIRLKGNRLIIPYSNSFRKGHKEIEIRIPPILLERKVKEIRIIPRANARFFEIQYTYEAECIERNLNPNHVLAIDPGIDNLMTGVTEDGKSFIIDGRRLKSVNQWYNKENARLQRIKDKQKYGKKPTARQQANTRDRNNKVNDYMNKAARKVIDYCIEHDIGTLVMGYSKEFQRSPDLGRKNNQTFVNIPYGRLMDKMEYLCKRNGIEYVKQEESYTSQASFFDQDGIPVYQAGKTENHRFSGKRISRGQYRTGEGKVLNADVNGALNILKKSKVVDLKVLYCRGEVDTPARIRVA